MHQDALKKSNLFDHRESFETRSGRFREPSAVDTDPGGVISGVLQVDLPGDTETDVIRFSSAPWRTRMQLIVYSSLISHKQNIKKETGGSSLFRPRGVMAAKTSDECHGKYV